MSAYIAIIASILMLATNAAWGRDRAAVLPGADRTAVHVTVADNGIPVTWAVQYGMDQKALNPMHTSAAPSVEVALTASRGGGRMHGSISGHSSRGHSFHSRPFGGHSFNRGHSFHGGQSFHRGFDRHHFDHRKQFFHGGFRHYPYGRYYSYPYRYYPYRYYPYSYYPYRYYYPYSYSYPYGGFYGNLGYVYPYPYSHFYFSW
jgi:hypothetical protein